MTSHQRGLFHVITGHVPVISIVQGAALF